MQKPIGNLALNLLLIATLSGGLYASLDWPSETKLFPQSVGFLVLALSLVVFGRDLRRVYVMGATVPHQTGEEGEDAYPLAAAVTVLAWLFGFGAAIWVFGFYIGAFLFVFFFIKVKGQLTTAASLGYAVVSAGGIYVIFVVILKQPAYPGLLLSYFNSF